MCRSSLNQLGAGPTGVACPPAINYISCCLSLHTTTTINRQPHQVTANRQDESKVEKEARSQIKAKEKKDQSTLQINVSLSALPFIFPDVSLSNDPDLRVTGECRRWPHLQAPLNDTFGGGLASASLPRTLQSST
ncbi:hypothetical protein TWF696_005521 [Orbilia brochopaga]|uniref:Uncharacterized protein n=1 Tax=Orbilia brochopaga TaxID=3140254 RepID=A0AAV9V491_9PEZI